MVSPIISGEASPSTPTHVLAIQLSLRALRVKRRAAQATPQSCQGRILDMCSPRQLPTDTSHVATLVKIAQWNNRTFLGKHLILHMLLKLLVFKVVRCPSFLGWQVMPLMRHVGTLAPSDQGLIAGVI